MQILIPILLILAYTLIVARLMLQTVCYFKGIEYKETLLHTLSFLSVLFFITADELNLFHGFIFGKARHLVFALLLVGLATAKSFKIHKERIVPHVKIKNRIVTGLTAVIIFTVLLFHLLGATFWADVSAIGYLFISVVYFIVAGKIYRRSFVVKDRGKIEKRLVIVMIVFLCVHLLFGVIAWITGFWDRFAYQGAYLVSAICIVLCLFMLPEDVKRCLLVAGKAEMNADLLTRFNVTAREQEVLSLLVKGKSYKEIGTELFISMPTVKTHVSNIYAKLNVKNKVELANSITIRS
ncbi:MAG: LuxR family transcriptional regulator [Desulfobacteraceae bacterium]|nr:MAG: LuxR family transcriptional regulator [Desulfobacteraceae bacterium]